MAKVTIYTMDHCPYCERAKALMKQRGVTYEESRVAMSDDAEWERLYRLSGMRTMPQIFADDRLVGGFRELSILDQKDQLNSLK